MKIRVFSSGAWMLLSLVLTVLGDVTLSPLTVHEQRHAFSGLREGHRVDSTSVTMFRIGLKQSNLDRAYEYLINISHPASPHYGKLWSSNEVQETFAPAKESVETVRNWLTTVGIDRVTESPGWLSFESTVGYVEEILNAEYFEYEHEYEHEDYRTKTVRIGCDRYYLPEHISKHIDYISPGVALSVPLEKRALSKRQPPSKSDSQQSWPSKKSKIPRKLVPNTPLFNDPRRSNASQLPPNLRNCGSYMTPACIRALYKLPNPGELASYGGNVINSLGVFEDSGEYNQSDLNLFFRLYAPEIPVGTGPTPNAINEPPIVQGKHELPTNGETNLDLMIMYPIVYPQTITLYQVSGRINRDFAPNVNEFPFLIQEFLDALDSSFCRSDPIPGYKGQDCGAYSPTRVISMSYDSSEIVFPESYLQRQCNEFMKLSLRGTTFTVSSGDYGVASIPGTNIDKASLTNGCILPGHFNAANSTLYGRNGTVFSGMFPATCPYVLSVGGTQLRTNETIENPESAMNVGTGEYFSFASGGGFSNYFTRPAYQNATVEAYFYQHDPGYPFYVFNGVDFSQPGNNIGANGGLYNRAGRGFPDVSAIGRHIPTVHNGVSFNTEGTSCAAPIWGSIFTLINEKRTEAGKGPVGFVNPVLYEHPEVFTDITLGTNPGCFTKGFSAVKGWDPVTGLGTPDFPKLLELFMSLP